LKINHIGIVVRNIEESLDYYKTCFGFITDDKIIEDKNQKVRIAFIRQATGNFSFELLEPLTKDSPVMNALRKGGGLNHICYEVSDINSSIQLLRENGCKLISGPTPAIAFGNSNIAFLYTRHKEIIELVEKS